MLQIYYADIRHLSAEIDTLPISDYRKKRLEAIGNPLKRRQSIGAELLLMEALKEKYPDISFPVRISETDNGKPQLVDLPAQFNLSHSGPYSACAIADVPFGLDIQVERAYHPGVSGRSYTAAERKVLETAPSKDYVFTMLWSLKESYLKALGYGLRRSMQSFSIVFDLTSDQAFCDGARFWHTYEDDCHFSLCIPGGQEIEKVELRKIKLL